MEKNWFIAISPSIIVIIINIETSAVPALDFNRIMLVFFCINCKIMPHFTARSYSAAIGDNYTV